MAPTVNSGDNGASSRRANHRRRPRHPPQTIPVQSNTLLCPQQIIPGTRRDLQASLTRRSTPPTDHSRDGARPTREQTYQPSSNSSSPPTNIPGDKKIPLGTNNGDHTFGRPHLSPGAWPLGGAGRTRPCTEDLPESAQHRNRHLAGGKTHPPPHQPSGKNQHSMHITDCGGQASSTCLPSRQSKYKPLPLELQHSRESREP